MAKPDNVRPVSDQDKRLAKKGWWFLLITLAGTLVAEQFMHPHPYFGMDGEPFFYAWFGFSACILIILISKLLGFGLKRDKDYYE